MGGSLSMLSEVFPPKSKFKVEDIPDLTGKVMIVTGGNTGIGKETIKALLNKNAKVYMASRSKQRAQEAIADLKQQTGREAIFLELDLANLKSVKRAVQTFTSQESHLHVLFNSGGVMIPPVSDLTTDGYDLQFGTNVLGHFYFTKLLLPTLIETAKATGTKARVITTSSSGHLFVNKIDYATMRDGPARKKLSTMELYAQSKFGNVIFAKELARRYGDQGIVSISLNPGNLKTELQRHSSKLFRMLVSPMLYAAPFGALTQLWGGTMPESADLNGKYLIPWARIGTPRKETQDSGEGEKLWKWLEEQVKDV